MILTEQDIRSTLNAYNNEGDADEYRARMHEAYATLTQIRPILRAAMTETPGPINASPFADLAKASALLDFALSAWEN